MLCVAKDILKNARENHYAIPGFNCIADVMLPGILDRVEKLRSPVFIMLFPADIDKKTWWYFPSVVHAVAKHYTIPIVLHLDHATDLDDIRIALDHGFTSVMFDGSSLPFDENVEMARKTVEMAKPYGASVEAELGRVGGYGMETAGTAVSNILTQPEEVVTYVERTGVDSLAVSIGNAHGIYPQLPQLDISLLKELNAASKVPLVLHGGSGTPDDQVRAAVQNGICKFNVYADTRVAMWNRFKSLVGEFDQFNRGDPPPAVYLARLAEAVGDLVEAKADIAGSIGRAEPQS
ncbi:MAG: class II fructose-bisphosphate aldolase [Planctomycetaceae bacterium]|jgi:fructose-bisphosphate aldolase class II|nr:class II fructose-bisphosphate aldolase [Planctomycetaceae bacterium]